MHNSSALGTSEAGHKLGQGVWTHLRLFGQANQTTYHISVKLLATNYYHTLHVQAVKALGACMNHWSSMQYEQISHLLACLVCSYEVIWFLQCNVSLCFVLLPWKPIGMSLMTLSVILTIKLYVCSEHHYFLFGHIS